MNNGEIFQQHLKYELEFKIPADTSNENLLLIFLIAGSTEFGKNKTSHQKFKRILKQ